jgi:arylsulfatase A-like enzyme
MMVFSSGSAGSAFMQNHTISGGAIINPLLILPESFRETVVRELGPIPEKGKVNTAVHRWVTDAWIKFGLAADGPLVSSIWYTDPDGTAHDDGIGATTSMESIRIVDAEFGRILKEVRARNLSDKINIIVSTDHGFVTYAGKMDVEEFLISKSLKKSKGSEDVIISGGAIYVANHDQEVIHKIVAALQAEPWIGAIFTKGLSGDMKGSIAGTLSFESIHWDHPTRSADILVDENWSHEKNDKGYPGTSDSQGVAGHGGLSPYEVHIALLASGPAFRKSYQSELPTSNVDLAPTILAIHGLAVPKEMDGRIVSELFVGTPESGEKPRVVETTVSSTIAEVQYKATLQRTILGRFSYVDMATVTRSRK